MEAGAAAAAAVAGRRSIPVKLQAIRDGLCMVVNGAGTGHNAILKGYDVSGKTGTAQVISNQGKERAGKTDKDLRDNGWFVFFAPRDKPADRRRRVPRARRPRLERGARRAPPDGHVLREEGRAAAAAQARSSRRTWFRKRSELMPQEMFERRLYYHIDWALLVAMLALCALGVAMIYSTTARSDARDVAPATSRSSTPSCSAWSRWCSC